MIVGGRWMIHSIINSINNGVIDYIDLCTTLTQQVVYDGALRLKPNRDLA